MIRKIDEKKNFYIVVNNLGLIIKVSKRLIRRVELEKKLSLKNDSIIKEEEKVRIVEKKISWIIIEISKGCWKKGKTIF